MASKKKSKTETKEAVELAGKTTANKVLVFKAKRPLTEEEHKQLSEKLRFEEEKSGVKIVLMPFSCEME